MKKGCLIATAIGVVLLLIAAGLVFFVFGLTKPMVEEGEKFLATVGAGSTEAAYGMASATLRSTQSKEEFTKAVSGLGLGGYQSASWSNRTINNDRGVIEGTATTAGGGSVPLKIELIKEDGTWRVLSITGPAAGARSGPIIEDQPAAATPKVPAADDAAAMVLASLADFNAAVQAKSFESFHAGIAKIWQQQTTAEKLLEAFQPLIDAGVNIEPAGKTTPVFKSPPAVNEDGVLVLDGHCPTTPNKVYFTLKYIGEGGAWKLFGVHVNVDE